MAKRAGCQQEVSRALSDTHPKKDAKSGREAREDKQSRNAAAGAASLASSRALSLRLNGSGLIGSQARAANHEDGDVVYDHRRDRAEKGCGILVDVGGFLQFVSGRMHEGKLSRIVAQGRSLKHERVRHGWCM